MTREEAFSKARCMECEEVPKEFWNDREFVLDVIRCQSGAVILDYVSKELLCDKGFVLEAIQANRHSPVFEHGVESQKRIAFTGAV